MARFFTEDQVLDLLYDLREKCAEEADAEVRSAIILENYEGKYFTKVVAKHIRQIDIAGWLIKKLETYIEATVESETKRAEAWKNYAEALRDMTPGYDDYETQEACRNLLREALESEGCCQFCAAKPGHKFGCSSIRKQVVVSATLETNGTFTATGVLAEKKTQ